MNSMYLETVFRCGYGVPGAGGTYPPQHYFQGRYSNGRVWVEYIADPPPLKSQTNNFAGGATTGNDRNSLVPGLQVQSFKDVSTDKSKCTVCAVGGSK